jgi:hypothetical protein
MPKRESVRDKLIKLSQENKYQTQSINEIKDLMKEHVKSSEGFRIQCSKNTSNINWLKKGIFSLFGIIGGVIVWIISSILLQ